MNSNYLLNLAKAMLKRILKKTLQTKEINQTKGSEVKGT